MSLNVESVGARQTKPPETREVKRSPEKIREVRSIHEILPAIKEGSHVVWCKVRPNVSDADARLVIGEFGYGLGLLNSESRTPRLRSRRTGQFPSASQFETIQKVSRAFREFATVVNNAAAAAGYSKIARPEIHYEMSNPDALVWHRDEPYAPHPPTQVLRFVSTVTNSPSTLYTSADGKRVVTLPYGIVSVHTTGTRSSAWHMGPGSQGTGRVTFSAWLIRRTLMNVTVH